MNKQLDIKALEETLKDITSFDELNTFKVRKAGFNLGHPIPVTDKDENTIEFLSIEEINKKYGKRK
jgi:hypothetical protein